MENYLSKLVSISSISGTEQKILKYIQGYLDKLGIKTTAKKHFVSGFIKGKNSKNCLVLNGHIDTVDIGDLSLWKTDPLKLTKKGNYLHGLGVSDMKAGAAVMMELASYYSKNTPDVDIYFSFVAHEETSGIGSREAAKWLVNQKNYKSYKNVSCLILEPTNNNLIEIGHRGNYFVKIYLVHKNHDLTGDLIKITKGLNLLEKKLENNFSNKELGSPTISITGITTGDINKSSLNPPSSAEIKLDIRTSPEVHQKVLDILKESLTKLTKADIRIELFATSNPGWTPETSLIRRVTKEVFPDIVHQVMVGSADLCEYTNYGISTIIFGPGQKATMHSPNESLKINSMEDSYHKIINLINHYANKTNN